MAKPVAPLQKNESTEVLVTICQYPPVHINLRLTMLRNHRQNITGKLLVIRDVTTLYQTQLDLQQMNIIQQQTQLNLKQTNEALESRLRENEALQHQLKEQAIRDGLTGLFNRRYFEETLLAEFAKARRSQWPLAIILLDVDYFKQINDTYGHQAGDRVLQVFAEVIGHHVRISDIVCRYGGEEFIIALPGMTLEEAARRAQRLRLELSETVIRYRDQMITATVSGGVGALPEHSGSQDGLISAVDKALYEAKRNGRDRIHIMQVGADVATSV
ncbi:MAG: GGDEF domain-containing protein [Phormidesmis sp. RL_2_1]|nr:GGDEF domain-containing protein [Phormidesmis sp. RL_2_1]